MKIIERIYDANTGETNDIEREITAVELEAFENAKLKSKNLAILESEAAIAKQALLNKLDLLGITEDEAKLLLS